MLLISILCIISGIILSIPVIRWKRAIERETWRNGGRFVS